MMKTQSFLLLVALFALLGLTSVRAEPVIEVVAGTEVDFIPLNPLRGDASPKAGVLWGDIRNDVPSGVLLKFADGFSSPPHIHNITYRAVVISGAVHNDDPDSEKMWMGPGSYWMQPAGEVHITAGAKGGATAFLEILEGPYLVQPSKTAYDSGERPVNLDARNVVWLTPRDVMWINPNRDSTAANDAKIAFLWGSPGTDEENGTFLKLSPKFKGELIGNNSWLRAVVIQGQTTHQSAETSEATTLKPGSYFGSKDGAPHRIACISEKECLLYVRTKGKFVLKRF